MFTQLVFAGLLGVANGFLGINLGNVLEAPLEGQWAPPAMASYFPAYAAAKFSVVRIPVRWDNHTSRSAPYTINATWMARVRTVVTWSTSVGLPVIINSHHDDWVDDPVNFPAMLPRFKAIWTQVAEEFSDFSDEQLSFEVLNEPVKMTIDQLNEMNAAVVPIMRARNPTRAIHLGGLQWMNPNWIVQNPEALIFPPLPSGGRDPNLRLEAHSYDPFNKCGGRNSAGALTPADVSAITAIYVNIGAWGVAHNRSVFMGEAGCSKYEDRKSRLDFYATIGAASRANIAGLAVWDDDGDFLIFDRAALTWDQGILDALNNGQ